MRQICVISQRQVYAKNYPRRSADSFQTVDKRDVVLTRHLLYGIIKS